MDVTQQYRIISGEFFYPVEKNNNERMIHSIKTGLACLFAYMLTQVVHFHVDQWIIITVVVVMCGQMSIGSILQKSYMRFLGTLTGSMYAACILFLFPKN